MRDNLFQMSDRSRHCPLLAVRDLHQNQNFIPESQDFPEALVQATLSFVGQASLHMANLDSSLFVLDLYVISIMLVKQK